MSSTNVTVSVKDEFNGQYHYLIEIFDQNPVITPSANLISRGLAKGNSPFVTKVTVPSTIKEIFIRQTAPNGLSSVRMASITNESINCAFGSETAKAAKSVTRATTDLEGISFSVPSSTDTNIFPTAAPSDAVNLPNSGWAQGTASAYKNLKVISTSTSVNCIGQYAAFYVTENASLSGGMPLTGFLGRKLFVLPGKKLTITGDMIATTNEWVISVGEGATLEINGHFQTSSDLAKIYNRGTIIVKTAQFQGKTQIYNAGTFQVTSTNAEALQLNSDPIFYNDGVVDVKGGWKTTNTAVIYNSSTGDITVAGKIFQTTGTNRLINDNTIQCGYFHSTGSARTQNNGDMTVAEMTTTDSDDTWINNGCWITKNYESITYNAVYYNNCKLYVNNFFNLRQSRFVNNSYIYAKDASLYNTRMEMGSESLMVVEGTTTLAQNRRADNEGFYGTGAKRALLKFTKVVKGDDAPNIVHYAGNLQIACDDHPERLMPAGQEPRWSMDSSVEWASSTTATITIPKTECNEGYGGTTTPPVEPPLDPVNDPYTYSYLFEDLWPLYGDYDMNDVVISVRNITKTMNNSNQITKLSFAYKLQAVGASRKAGGALMLDGISATNVQSVTYSSKTPTGFSTLSSGVEAGQDYAVIPLFLEAHAFLGRNNGVFVNTVIGSADNVTNVPEITIEVTFATPVAPTFDISSFNMFIISGDDNLNNRKEIHLRGYKPSLKAASKYFGSNNDASTPSLYYVSKENLVWGIVVPSSFKWSKEYLNIQEAYPSFTNWVQSGGTQNTNWWESPKNSESVFHF